MTQPVILCFGALSLITWAIVRQDQLSMFTGDWFSPLFVLLGGTFIALSVSKDRENLLIERLEAFRTGCILFGAVGTLIPIVAIMGGMDNPMMIGPAHALALTPLLWAACLNYIAKLVIISKSGGGQVALS